MNSPILPETTAFDKAWIRTGFQTTWCDDDNDKPIVVTADYFRQQHSSVKDYEHKVVIGHVLQINTPKSASTNNLANRIYSYAQNTSTSLSDIVW